LDISKFSIHKNFRTFINTGVISRDKVKHTFNSDTDILTPEEFERAMKLSQILMQGLRHKEAISKECKTECMGISYTFNTHLKLDLDALINNPKGALNSSAITDESRERFMKYCYGC
jgi:hypothetical protein